MTRSPRTRIASCLENTAAWLLGGVFLLAGVRVLFTAPRAESPWLTGLLGLLALHTAAMSIVGFGLGKATRVLGISWVIFLAAFLVLAAVLRA